MAKGSGTTRSGGSSNPRGLGGGTVNERNPLGDFGRRSRAVFENNALVSTGKFQGQAMYEYEKGMPNEPEWMKEKKSAGKWVDVPESTPLYLNGKYTVTNIGEYKYVHPSGNESSPQTRVQAKSFNTQTGEFSRHSAKSQNDDNKRAASREEKFLAKGRFNSNELDKSLRTIGEYWGTGSNHFKAVLQKYRGKISPYSQYFKML